MLARSTLKCAGLNCLDIVTQSYNFFSRIKNQRTRGACFDATLVQVDFLQFWKQLDLFWNLGDVIKIIIKS